MVAVRIDETVILKMPTNYISWYCVEQQEIRVCEVFQVTKSEQNNTPWDKLLRVSYRFDSYWGCQKALEQIVQVLFSFIYLCYSF